jgi:hypothetical protein
MLSSDYRGGAMTEQTWGYAGQVGEWLFQISIPDEHREPRSAMRLLLERVRDPMAMLHRPGRMLVSWGELDTAGHEVAFHDLDEHAVSDWDSVIGHLEGLTASEGRSLAVSCVFVRLDTLVAGADGESWVSDSAELQVSLSAPELAPMVAASSYSTYVDVWLSTTYGTDDGTRSNRQMAARNRPRLQQFLLELKALASASLRAGQSQLYHFAITDEGFCDVDAPPRRTNQRPGM